MEWSFGRPIAALPVVALLLLFVERLPAGTDSESPFREGGHEALVERVNTSQAGEYRRVLTEFDAYLERHPDDSIAAVERCDFIESFAYAEEPTIEAASADAEKCEQGLRNGPNANSSAVTLYLWLHEWEGDVIERGEGFVKEYSPWTERQRAALHESLSNRYAASDPRKSGAHAMKALGLDPRSYLRLRAAEHLVSIGAKRRAVAMIEEMPKEQWNTWTLGSALTTLLGMDETAAARRLVEAHAEIDIDAASRLKLARSMVAAGETEAGRALVARLTDGSKLPDHFGVQLERELFAFQLEHGSAQQAVASYRLLRDKGFGADAFGRQRLALTFHHWTAPWQWPDLLGLGAFVAFLCIAALLPLVVVVPVHYRSAVKRSRGFVLAPLSDDSPWSLRSVWYALAALAFAGSVTLYIYSYPQFDAAFSQLISSDFWQEPLSDERALGRAVLWGEILGLLLLLPLLRGVRIGPLLLGNWSPLRSILVGASLAIVLLFVNGIVAMIVRSVSQAGIGLGTDTTRAMQGVSSLYGPAAMFVTFALVIPIVEELVFRGILLRSVARHVGVWTAALAQAALFVVFHEGVTTFPFLFAFALAASWLAWSSGGLLAPIVMHVVNNGIAVFAVLGVTRALNAT